MPTCKQQENVFNKDPFFFFQRNFSSCQTQFKVTSLRKECIYHHPQKVYLAFSETSQYSFALRFHMEKNDQLDRCFPLLLPLSLSFYPFLCLSQSLFSSFQPNWLRQKVWKSNTAIIRGLWISILNSFFYTMEIRFCILKHIEFLADFFSDFFLNLQLKFCVTKFNISKNSTQCKNM